MRDPRIADDEAGYGQVVELRLEASSELRLLWNAPTGSVTAPFIPYHLGIDGVLAELGEHRYLTKGAGQTFVSTDYQAQEATLFAGRLFKRLMYYTCERPEKFLPEVTEALEHFEARRIAELPQIEAVARTLLSRGEKVLATAVLTRYAAEQSEAALELGQDLLASIEARTRLLYGIRRPAGTSINEEADADRVTVTCRSSVDKEGPVIAPDTAPEPPPPVVSRGPEPDSPDPDLPPGKTGPGWIGVAGGLAGGLLLGLVVGAALFRRRQED